MLKGKRKTEKNCQQRILYLPKLSFRNEAEKKTFLDKQKLREFLSSEKC